MAKLVYPAVAETGMRRNDIMNQVNQLVLYVSRTIPFCFEDDPVPERS
jgi:hypothetical protein